MELAHKLKNIKPSPTIAVTMKAKELQSQGKDIIGLGAGEPDFDTYDDVKEAAIKAIRDGKTKYTAVDGTPELKKAVIQKFKKENNIEYNLDEITVGTGAKQIIYNALMASINEGDEVIIPAPYWVSYPDMTLLAGGVPVIVNCLADNDFKLTSSDLEKAITNKTKWLIINSPSNPTGSAYSKKELEEIGNVLEKYPHVNILSDDIYEHILYDGFEFATIASVKPSLKSRTLTLNGVSKAYSMTGWRIGYAGAPKELIKAIAIIQSQSTSNPCSISQEATVEALLGKQDYIKERCKKFEQRRDMVVKKLNEIDGIVCREPNGAFYVFPSCKGLIGKKTPKGEIIKNDNDFSTYLLEEALVAVVPGVAFGAPDFFRISYATSDDILVKAMERIKLACDKLKN